MSTLMAIGDPSVEGRATTQEVRMELMTPAVEKAIGDLHPADREKVVEALLGPVRLDHCSLVARLSRKYRVFKFGIDRNLRVCYRILKGRACVIYAGPHDDFDKFTERYKGSLPDRFIPISESILMSRSEREAGKARGDKPEPKTPALAIPPQGEDLGLLSPGFLECLERAASAERRRTEENIDTMGDLLRTSFGEELTSISERLDRERGDLRSTLNAASEKLAGEVRAELDAIEARLVELRLLEKADVDRLTGRVEALGRAAEAREAEAILANGSLAGEIDALTRSLATSLGEVEGRIGRIEAGAITADALEAQADELLAIVSGQAEELRRLERDLAESRAEVARSREIVEVLRTEHDREAKALSGRVDALERADRALLGRLDSEQVERHRRSFLGRASRILESLRSESRKRWPRE